jgi:hypothetical protein
MATIHRSKRNTPFVQIDKRGLQDVNLSWKAKGILAYLLSLPDDWQIRVKELENHSTDGRDSTANGIKELIEAGYIKRERARNEKNQFKGYDYTVYEVPEFGAINGVPGYGFPVFGFPVYGKPVFGKPVTTNKEGTNKEYTNNNSLSQEKSGIENSLKSEHDIEKEKSCAKKESLPPEEQRILEAKKEVMRYFEEWPAMKERAEAAIQGSGKALSVVLEEWARNRLKVPYVLQNAHSHVSSDFIPWCDREGKFSAARKRKSEKKNTQGPAPIVNEYGKKREKGNELGLF